MFINTALIQTLNDALAATQNGQTNKQGEQMLRELRENPQYPILLFDYFQNQGNMDQLRLLAAVQFQHWFKEYKNADDYLVQQYSEIVSSVKQSIIQCFVSTNKNISKQVEQAILFLASKEFPYRWNTLIQELMSYIDFNLQNNEQNIRILKVLDKITDRYSYSMRSDELFTEIIIVCDNCHDHLYKLIENVLLGLEQQHDTLNTVKILKFIMKIFYNLNYQDLHPKFEDNLNNWMGFLSKTIQIKVDPATMGGHDVTLFKAKGECLRAVLLYATRYREEFQDLIEHFAGEIWTMCSITDQDQKFDKIVINALKYFKNLVLWQDLGSFFKQNMNNIMTSLIIPNLGVSQMEKLQFEDEPTSFLESFFQFSDINTRKSVTVDLLKNIAKGFGDELVGQIKNYILEYKNLLDSTGQFNIETEVILLNLIIDGATVAYRDKEGVTEICLPAELVTYIYENIIKPTLGKMFSVLSQNQNMLVEQQYNTLHVCYYLRFFYYFRNIINRDEILELARIVSFFLRSKQESLVGLAAITIEGLLNLKEGDLKNYINVKNYFNKDNVYPQINEIIMNLYLCCQSQEEIDGNLLKTLFYIINLLKEKSLEKFDLFVGLFNDQFQKMLSEGYDFQRVSILFECVSNLMNLSSTQNSQGYIQLEKTVSPYFDKIISQFISDLINYVLQTYSIIIRNTNNIDKNNFKIIFESLINPTNWTQDNVSIFPSFIIYIQSYIYRIPSIIVTYKTQLEQIFVQFLKLKQDTQFFEFARIFIQQFQLDELRQSGWLQFFIQTCLNFYSELAKENKQVTSKSKGSKPIFVKNFIVFISYLIQKYTTQQILVDFNAVQQDSVINILIEEINLIKNISDLNEKKVIFTALMDILFNNTSAISLQAFSLLLNAIIENLGTRRFRPARYTEQRDNLNSMGGSGFQRLSCLKEKNTLIPEIQNLDQFFAQQFNLFYSNPTIKNSLNMAEILNLKNQETLSKLITQGQSK
ncbi:CAS/CSE protein, carboxy-terminal protein (macronuclear) [Tetrahymena thermophila SB210]|uniref:CAS/CSE protein, carboxy-terminal protein n=1 Tax=Tetrahymena thermophila (strain SB210) TaxID=312017 RepID=I7MJ43_TETTS|nr:CAS/CSE protein, carboxy-terminal protein [Tetrahymena thermophila SB210]EAR95791.1 CAS/CSE protein, carboxy-terminal protein [Tetrahymena thermophila SB210]|eukprot:XP_001016036.1 CAS/CSE protein, carboxy-terminal protein [Tetrahymena thermophila SB210]